MGDILPRLEELIKSPLVFLTIKNKGLIREVNDLMPYSIGMEINACYKYNNEVSASTWRDNGLYDVTKFWAIPDIMEINSTQSEQRYRIPNGVVGMICLYNLSIQLKLMCDLNPTSGIHYHVDCNTDESYYMVDNGLLEDNKEWILKELDGWGYLGSYNKRGMSTRAGSDGNWVRTNPLKTVEFRMGEMTFDYEQLLKRVLHISDILKRVKKGKELKPVYKEIDVQKQLEYQKMVEYSLNPTMTKTQILTNLLGQMKEIENKEKEEKDKAEGKEEIVLRKRLHRL